MSVRRGLRAVRRVERVGRVVDGVVLNWQGEEEGKESGISNHRVQPPLCRNNPYSRSRTRLSALVASPGEGRDLPLRNIPLDSDQLII